MNLYKLVKNIYYKSFPLNSKRGYSLSEVLVVTVIMGIVTTLSGVLVINLQTMVTGTSKQLVVDEVNAEITMILSDPTACFRTFGASGFTGAPVALTQVINNLSVVRFDTTLGPYNQTVTLLNMTATNFLTGVNADVPTPFNGRFDFAVTYRYRMKDGLTRDVQRVITIKTQSITNWVGGNLAYDPAVAPQVGCSANAGVAFGFDIPAGSYMTRNLPDTKFGNLTINGNFEVQGMTTINSEFLQISDRRYKYNLRSPFKNFEKINKVNAYNFSWKSNHRQDYGFIAQEVEAEYPEIVRSNQGSRLSKTISYSSMVPILAQSSKELISKNKVMKKDLENLDKLVKRLEEKKGKK